jgi:hypothetical protein
MFGGSGIEKCTNTRNKIQNLLNVFTAFLSTRAISPSVSWREIYFLAGNALLSTRLAAQPAAPLMAPPAAALPTKTPAATTAGANLESGEEETESKEIMMWIDKSSGL